MGRGWNECTNTYFWRLEDMTKPCTSSCFFPSGTVADHVLEEMLYSPSQCQRSSLGLQPIFTSNSSNINALFWNAKRKVWVQYFPHDLETSLSRSINSQWRKVCYGKGKCLESTQRKAEFGGTSIFRVTKDIESELVLSVQTVQFLCM